MSTGKKILIGVGVLIILSAIGKVMGGKNAESATAATEAAAPAAAVAAGQLYGEYRANEVKADEQYKNKTLAVTGTVISIGKDIMDRPYVVLGTGESEYEMTGVQCLFEDKQAVAAMSKGQKITVTGTCEGKMMNVQMKNCHI